MPIHEQIVRIDVAGRKLAGTVVSPSSMMAGSCSSMAGREIRVSIWARAREIGALGCVCLTFDLYGHATTMSYQGRVTREDNLADIVATYDTLAEFPLVDRNAIAAIGSSYGGYLCALRTTLRPVKWLALRAPALYKDAEWTGPKQLLNLELTEYRRSVVKPTESRALVACARFRGRCPAGRVGARQPGAADGDGKLSRGVSKCSFHDGARSQGRGPCALRAAMAGRLHRATRVLGRRFIVSARKSSG